MDLCPEAVARELDAPFPLDAAARTRFREQGYLKVPGVFSA